MKRHAFLLLSCSISFVLGCDIPEGADDDFGDDSEESDCGTTDPSDTSGNDTSTDGSGTTDPSDTGDSGTEGCDTGEVTNACGTFGPDMHDNTTIPQDPDDPEIIAACTALCEVQTAGIDGCTTEAAACLEHCKMRSCEVCPGTLAPLVDCEAAMFVGEGCSCDADGIDCPVPAGCSDLEDQTGFCGG